ncbi:hypothetical protein ACFFRR_006730 [Megaselia abdita]
MRSELFFIISSFYFVDFSSATNKCSFNNCQNSTKCSGKFVKCSQKMALKSINYLNGIFDNVISTEDLPNTFKCFTYITHTTHWYDDKTSNSSYTDYRSCITENVDVCQLGKEEKNKTFKAVLTGITTGATCDQCEEDLCNKTNSFSFKIAYAIISIVLFFIFFK